MLKVLLVSFILTLLNTAHLQNITCRNQNVNQTSKPYTELEFESQQILPSKDGLIGMLQKELNISRNITRVQMLTPCNPFIVPDYERAVCPWTYVNNTDPDRIPAVMYEANCTTSECRCVQVLHNQHRRPMCHEIYHYVQVLRKVSCGNGRKEYKKVMERLASGCGCFLPAGDACYTKNSPNGPQACETTKSESPKTHEK